jgi:hypothetical protein
MESSSTVDLTGPTGPQRELKAKEIFSGIGLPCIYPLNDVQLRDLDSVGAYGADEHLEFDFLLPYGRVCVIGEVTGRSEPRDFDTLKSWRRL